MNKDTVVMIGIFLIAVAGISLLIYFRILSDLCETSPDKTNPLSICFDPVEYCKKKCEYCNDTFTENITDAFCICNNSAYAHDPTLKRVRECWTNIY